MRLRHQFRHLIPPPRGNRLASRAICGRLAYSAIIEFTDQGTGMLIASFNINGIRARMPRLLEWLDERQPDVACLQEIKCQDPDFPAGEFEKIGYGAAWHGQKGFNGVAILARGSEPQDLHVGLPGDPDDEQARYIEADIGGVRVANLYLPNGNPHPGPKFDYKIAWMGRLRERMRELWQLERPTVLLGDFNVIPEDKDV